MKYKQYPGITGSIQELQAVSRNYRQYPGITGSIQEL